MQIWLERVVQKLGGAIQGCNEGVLRVVTKIDPASRRAIVKSHV